MNIAYFITPHGFGHAARASGVMAAVHARCPRIRFEIFTTVPSWLFAESLTGPWTYHPTPTDIGLVQTDALTPDLDETADRLERFLPLDPATIAELSHALSDRACRMVVCDIAPLGIAAAKAAGVPSVLVENFTWDWIYEAYRNRIPRMGRYIDYLASLFAAADYHIQAEPFCSPARADLVTHPISRKPRTPPDAIRRQLHIPAGAKAVIVSMGGIPAPDLVPARLPRLRDTVIVMPGTASGPEAVGSFRLLAHNSGIYHPDLIGACDAVITKTGYSTLAEAYHGGGPPVGYIPRGDFRESPVLEAFVREKMKGLAFTDAQVRTGRWVERLPDLLALPRSIPEPPNGADQAARFILDRLAG